MTTSELNADTIEKQARALLDSRVSTVRALVTARQAAIDARAVLAEAEKAEALAYATAEKAGWSGDELAKLGLAGATRKRPGRPKSQPRAGTKATAAGARDSGEPSPAPQP